MEAASQQPRTAPVPPTPPASPAGRRRPSLPVVLALVAVLAGSAAVVLAVARSRTSASDTPAEAVDRTLRALADRDALGLVASLAPEEREALAGALPDAVDALQRLDLLDDVDLADVEGVTVELDAPRYTVHARGADAAAVDVVAGRLTAAGSDGLALTGRADTALATTFDWNVLDEATRDFAQRPLRLVAVRREGSWHVSLGATVLEAVLDGDTTGPPGASPVEPVGAASPGAAVRALLDGWADGDLAASLAVLDPAEAVTAYAWSTSLLAAAPPTAATVERFATSTSGSGGTRTVRVDELEVALRGNIDHQRITYDGVCFTVERRFDPDATPWITFETCDGDEPTPHPDDVVNAGRVDRGGESLPTDPAGLDPDLDLDAGVRLGPEAVDSSILERQASAPRRRPHDDPLSAMAHFGGGADLPTFVVVERDGRWYVQPAASVVRSVLDALAATDPDEGGLVAARIEEAFRADDATRVILEARDPDNVLYGSATAATSPLVAECFRTVISLAGDVAIGDAGTACVRQLEAEGRLDGQPVPALLGAAECLMVGPTEPPAADVAVRRFYLVAVARRACVADRVADGSLPEGSLAEVEDPVDVACWAPYAALAPQDPEQRWAAADAEVAACGGLTGD